MTTMAQKSSALAVLLVAVAVVGQIQRGFAEAASTASGNVGANVLISGQVPCSNGTSTINEAAVPAFPNATVQLVCDGTVVASAVTDGNGSFAINLQGNVLYLQNLLTYLLANKCNAVVTTPLVACNASLAGSTGTLTAPLQIQGSGIATGSGGGPIKFVTKSFNFGT